MDDPFNIFDAQPPKKSRVEQVAGPESSLLPLVRAFVVQNARRTSEDLLPQLAGSASSGAAASGAAPTSVADDLESLVALLQMESPKERADSIAPATRIEAATWSLLSQRGAWPHVAWREAYVLSQWVLSYTDAVRNAPTDALRRLDRAFILGGPSEMLRNAMAVMEAAIDTPATHATPLDAVIDTQPSEQVSSEKVSSEKVSSERSRRGMRSDRPSRRSIPHGRSSELHTSHSTRFVRIGGPTDRSCSVGSWTIGERYPSGA